MIRRTREEQEQLVNECRASGKPAKAWCKSRGISYSTYMGWQNLIKQGNIPKDESSVRREVEPARECAQPEPPVVWAALDTKTDDVSEGQSRKPAECCISLSRGGWSISVGDRFDAGLLAEVMRVVDRVCC